MCVTDRVMTGSAPGVGSIGKLVTDDALYERAREISDEAKAVMTNVRDVTEEARRVIADFRAEDGPAQGVLSDMRMTLAQARGATADLADNMEALKRNFLLRGFFNRRGYYDLDAISRSAVACLRVLLGEPAPAVDGRSSRARRVLDAVVNAQKPYWPTL